MEVVYWQCAHESGFLRGLDHLCPDRLKSSVHILPFALLHFLNDAISGYLIGSMVQTGHGELEIVFAILVYNVIAFGGQWFFAEFARQYLTSKRWLIFSMSLLICAPLLFPFAWKIYIFLIGFSCALVLVEVS